jgi:hypothetical protein
MKVSDHVGTVSEGKYGRDIIAVRGDVLRYVQPCFRRDKS